MLKHLTHQTLLADTLSLVVKERATTAEILIHLEEIDRRKLYAELGYPSMIKFCIKHLGYSEGASYRRVQSARLVREIPEALPLIEAGKMTLTNLSKVGDFCQAEKIKDSEIKKGIVKEMIGVTSREAENKLLQKSSPTSPFRRKNILRQVTPTDWELTVTLSDSIKQKLDQIKNLKSYSIRSFEDLLNYLVNQEIARIDKPVKIKAVTSNTRCATNAQKKILLKKAGYQCEYETDGIRCEGRSFLAADHRIPWADGGKTELHNLRVLCFAHNQTRGKI